MAYQTAADIRDAVSALSNATTYPDATLEALVAEFEEIAEQFCGVAFEPRTASETFVLYEPTSSLLLAQPKIRSVTSVVVTAPLVGGTATTLSSTTYGVDPLSGILVYRGVFTAGSKVVVGYTHGEDAPSDASIRACRQYVRSCAMADQSGVPRDVIGQSFEGSYTRYSTPDWKAGRPTGYLEVDRLLCSLGNYRTGGLA